MTTTDRARFDAALAAGHRVVPVVRELFADAETPIGVYRKIADGRPGTFLLESADQGGHWSQWSFVGAASFGVLTADGDRAVWQNLGGLDARRALGDDAPAAPLEALRRLYERWATPHDPELPPLTGGLVGYIGWEAIRQIERLPDAPRVEVAIPSQAMAFVSELVALDHRSGTVSLIATVLADTVLADTVLADTVLAGDGAEPDRLWADAQQRLDALEERLARPAEAWIGEIDPSIVPEPVRRTSPDDFRASVRRSKDFIRDGDVFQVVISQRFDLPTAADPLDVYRVLRTLNPSPYMYLTTVTTPDGRPLSVVGSSPEALVKVQGSRVYSHPIAGSRPRGATPEHDVQLADELLADEKERSEHLMLVDLARNDVSKIAVPGSVEVTEFMRIERFSHIMHIVSSVEGDVREGVSPIDVFRATFPAGTLSGAPKPRALQIIDELEPAQRGVYGGVVGYMDFAGDTDLAIAIRTATILDGTAHVQAGGGLVADSDPQAELEESQNKAAAPLRAVAVASALRRRS